VRRPRSAGDGQARFDCGAGISNSGTIAALTNSGVLSGGSGGSGRVQGSAGDTIYGNGFIGPIANSGSIVGNVEINQIVGNVVSVMGGSCKASGQWSPPRSTLSWREARPYSGRGPAHRSSPNHRPGDPRVGLPRPWPAQTQEGGRNRATVTLSSNPFPAGTPLPTGYDIRTSRTAARSPPPASLGAPGGEDCSPRTLFRLFASGYSCEQIAERPLDPLEPYAQVQVARLTKALGLVEL
jgi:hypothetical protein